MPQPKKAGRFGGTAAHHNMIMANLTTELFRHGRINTTFAKAKTVQPLAEKMITFAKRGDVAARREVLKIVRDKDVVHKLFADVGPAFAERDGGYTRVLKLGPRKGDYAPMALIELVEGIGADGDEGTLEEAPKRRWSLRRRRGSQSATARERAEERAAAIDRGEVPEDFDEDVDEDFDEDDAAEQTDSASPTADDADRDEDDEGVQADPAEVEARLAAEEAAEADDAGDDGDDAGEPDTEEIAEQTDSASPTADTDEKDKD